MMIPISAYSCHAPRSPVAPSRRRQSFLPISMLIWITARRYPTPVLDNVPEPGRRLSHLEGDVPCFNRSDEPKEAYSGKETNGEVYPDVLVARLVLIGEDKDVY
jgi:hypothetical protein